MIWERTLSTPTACASTTSKPSPFSDPPMTFAPSIFLTGSLSPVRSDSSTWLDPSKMKPSTGMRSPGKTNTRSLGKTCSRGRSRYWSSGALSAIAMLGSMTFACSGQSFCSARIASLVCCFARASNHLPRSTIQIMTADPSK